MYAQMPALLLGVIATSLVATTTFWNQWSISGPTSKLVLGPIWAWRSLFSECLQYVSGQSQCQGMNSMFLMAAFRLSIRGFMITAIILSSLSCIMIFLGSECTRILEEKRDVKRKIMFASGVGFLLSGILTFASVLWYTIIVYNDFFKLETRDNFIQWELGGCVYLGYITSFVCILAFFACVCRPGPRKKDDDEDSMTAYFYNSKFYEKKLSKDDITNKLLDNYKSQRFERLKARLDSYERQKSSEKRKNKTRSKKRDFKKSVSTSTGESYAHSEYV